MWKRLSEELEIVEIIVYENDSTDGTLDKLHNWQLGCSDDFCPRLTVISEVNLTTTRTETLANGRNQLWDLVRSLYHNRTKEEKGNNGINPHFEFVLSMDFD